MLEHHENPDKDLKNTHRLYLSQTRFFQRRVRSGSKLAEVYDARIRYLAAWLAIHVPHPDNA